MHKAIVSLCKVIMGLSNSQSMRILQDAVARCLANEASPYSTNRIYRAAYSTYILYNLTCGREAALTLAYSCSILVASL